MFLCEVGSQDGNAQSLSNVDNVEAARFFWGRDVIVTINGRTALDIVLKSIGLMPGDDIYVDTTFGGNYVSSCVTSLIFNYCRPSKIFTDNTKAIIVIHEFGVPHNEIVELACKAKMHNIPLIENCAHSMASSFRGKSIGSFGDYSVYSFRKSINLPVGGAVVGNFDNEVYSPSLREKRCLIDIEWKLSDELNMLQYYGEIRRRNFLKLEKLVGVFGCKPMFKCSSDVYPYAFPFVVIDKNMKESLIVKFSEQDIESFSWRGDEIVVLPVHQFLKEDFFNKVECVLDGFNRKYGL